MSDFGAFSLTVSRHDMENAVLTIEYLRTAVVYHSFSFVILADNVNQFKNRLDKHWKMHDIVFNYRADFAETGGLA